MSISVYLLNMSQTNLMRSSVGVHLSRCSSAAISSVSASVGLIQNITLMESGSRPMRTASARTASRIRFIFIGSSEEVCASTVSAHFAANAMPLGEVPAWLSTGRTCGDMELFNEPWLLKNRPR
jgi:hypothetical protein